MMQKTENYWKPGTWVLIWELSNEYQHDRAQIVFKNICILVLWAKVALASEGLNSLYGEKDICTSMQCIVLPSVSSKFSRNSCCLT